MDAVKEECTTDCDDKPLIYLENVPMEEEQDVTRTSSDVSSPCSKSVALNELLAELEDLPSDLSDVEFSGESESDSEDESDSEENMTDSDENDPSEESMQHTPSQFQWQKGSFVPNIHQFDDKNCGLLVNIEDDCTVFDIFKLFFPHQIMQHLAQEMNKNYFVSSQKTSPEPHSESWVDTTPEELYVFLGVTMLMARIENLTIAEYWTDDPLLANPQFADYMPKDRYTLLLKLLHFYDETQPEGKTLHKLNPIINHLRSTFGAVLSPFQNLCIHESLVLFKNFNRLQRYISSKWYMFGIKAFVLRDCETGYILDFILYTGTTPDINDSVVKILITKNLDKGHNLWLPYSCSSPALYNWLHANGTNACGTVRKNKNEMPKMTTKLGKGQVETRHTDNILALRWMDRQEVCLLTTFHTDTMKPAGKINRKTKKEIVEPECVVDFESNMDLIDTSGMMISSLAFVQKIMKWHRKLFYHLLDITILNSHAVYNVKTGKNITLLNFQLTLIKEIFKKFDIPFAEAEQPSRLIESHYPSFVPPTPTNAKPAKKCYVCAHTTQGPKRRKYTKYMCADCDVSLCLVPCFKTYHTELEF